MEHRLVTSTGEYYQVSVTGKQALKLLNDAVGNIQDDSTWVVSSVDSEIVTAVTSLRQSINPAGNAADAPNLVYVARSGPPDQKIMSDRASDEKIAFTSETVGKDTLPDAA